MTHTPVCIVCNIKQLVLQQRPFSALHPMKKFNIDTQTRKFIRIRDTTGSSSSSLSGKQTGMSVMGGGGDTEGEKELNRLAAILKV